MLTRGILITFLLLITVSPALGHKLLVIAWVQGDQLMVETAFGTGQTAPGTQITVLSKADGATLLSGFTDEQGFFQATLDARILQHKTPLLVNATDGAGHLVEQTILAEDLGPLDRAFDVESTASKQQIVDSPAEASGIEPELLRELVRDAVRREMTPLRRDILALRQSGPGIAEVIGGIGWIVGLASLGALFLRRKTTSLK